MGGLELGLDDAETVAVAVPGRVLFLGQRQCVACVAQAGKSYPCMPTERLTSVGIMGEPRVPPFNFSETIVLSEYYRL